MNENRSGQKCSKCGKSGHNVRSHKKKIATLFDWLHRLDVAKKSMALGEK